MDALVEKVLGAVFEVSNTLGAGLLEKVYERALLKELHLRGLSAAPPIPLPRNLQGRGDGQKRAVEVRRRRSRAEFKQLVAEHEASGLGGAERGD